MLENGRYPELFTRFDNQVLPLRPKNIVQQKLEDQPVRNFCARPGPRGIAGAVQLDPFVPAQSIAFSANEQNISKPDVSEKHSKTGRLRTGDKPGRIENRGGDSSSPRQGRMTSKTGDEPSPPRFWSSWNPPWVTNPCRERHQNLPFSLTQTTHVTHVIP